LNNTNKRVKASVRIKKGAKNISEIRKNPFKTNKSPAEKMKNPLTFP